jgi:hypothetical protein
MKKILLSILFPFLGFSQTQIGSDIDGEAAFDLSGTSVCLSSNGGIVAIGATRNDNNGSDSGHVRVYQNNLGIWTQIGNDIDGEATDDLSGFKISLSSNGSILAIGSYHNDGNGGNSGHVRVYQNNSGNWSQVGNDINGEVVADFSGFSVSLSSDGTILAIGAVSNDGNGANSGHVRVYQNISGNWVQLGNDIDGEATGDSSGSSVSLSSDGTIVAIGATSNDGNGVNSGHVRVYQNISGNWVQLGSDIDGEVSGDSSGFSVSLSADGSVVAIGAPNNDGNGFNSGHVRVYQNISGNWIQLGSDIDGEVSIDQSGFSVSLSSNGSIVAIGAFSNDGNGTVSGHVRVYKNNSGNWTQIGNDIDGEAANDSSGYSVSLSSDGSVLAIGAPNNDGNGVDSGHVRIFDLTAFLASDNFFQANFSVYPNPASKILTIELQNNFEFQKANIYNTLGKIIKSYNSSEINVSDLSAGTYFIEVFTNKGKSTKTIIVE